MMSELERLDEALEWYDERVATEMALGGDCDELCAVGDAARAYRDLLANGERAEPDYEAAAEAIYDYGLPTATHDKGGRRVPFDRAMMTDSFRQAARAAVGAAIGDRLLLSVGPQEAENG